MEKNNLSIVRQQFAQCVFNHKMHEKASDRLDALQDKIKWINIILLALVIVFLILQIYFPEQTIFGGISTGITVFEILYAFFQKEFSIEDRAKEHKKIALQYLGLRDKYKNFVIDIMNDLESEKIVSKRDLLQDQYQIINSLSLQTTYADYEKAQLDLLGKTNKDEQFTWSDTEINRFLPKDLHI
ncbi:SLATT domain-containing protein [Patescibacteria group bacterium]|nr:SLATT domain-containing protein [Patescibacteria group bacterium]